MVHPFHFINRKKQEKKKLTELERHLLRIVRAALNKKRCSKSERSFAAAHANELLALAKEQAVISLLYDALLVEDEDENCAYAKRLADAARVVVWSNYRLLFLTKYVTSLLEAHGIRAIVLKGMATACYYPVPELRKAGDVDILIADSKKVYRAVSLLEAEGFWREEEQHAHHHVALKNSEGITVEVHSTLAEEFDSVDINRRLNRFLPEFAAHTQENTYWGFSFFQPQDAYHAFYLILHMLQHFLRAGFGLKFLCDWVVFWDRPVKGQEKETFLRLLEDSGTKGFVSVVTAACVEYLGLERVRVEFLLQEPPSHATVELFLSETLAAGEFGHGKQNRMVAMRGTGLGAYIREFHHQMHLNYPRAGKLFLCWPVLWSLTLVRFLYNNRTLRRVNSLDILKEAGRRSRLVNKMHLFSK